MLFYPTKMPGILKVSYDEPSSTLFIWYTNKPQEAYRIDRSFYEEQIFPVLNKDLDIRGLIIWGERNNFVEKVINAHLTSKLNIYE